jgi:hypothetical protein
MAYLNLVRGALDAFAILEPLWNNALKYLGYIYDGLLWVAEFALTHPKTTIAILAGSLLLGGSLQVAATLIPFWVTKYLVKVAHKLMVHPILFILHYTLYASIVAAGTVANRLAIKPTKKIFSGLVELAARQTLYMHALTLMMATGRPE